jgi:transcriptional regulator with XRE-family HTH domain
MKKIWHQTLVLLSVIIIEGDMMMYLNTLLKEKNITVGQLSKISGVSLSTINDISSSKTSIEKCAVDTLFILAKTLNVIIYVLMGSGTDYRQSFEAFKSTICHQVHNMGDIDFIIMVLESGEIRRLLQEQWYRWEPVHTSNAKLF